jgi:hypothetical protein
MIAIRLISVEQEMQEFFPGMLFVSKRKRKMTLK